MQASVKKARDPYCWRSLILLILPLVAEQTLAITVGMADTVMVSGVGESAIAAVSTVNELNNMLINLFSALSAGGSIVAAQYLGHGDLGSARKAAKQLLISAFSVAFILASVCLLFNRQIIGLMDNGSDLPTLEQSYTYLSVTALSFPFLALYNGGISLLRAMRNTKASMWTSMVMNAINIGGNALLIHPCGMGVAGAAAATLISRAAASVIILRLLRKPVRPIWLEPVHSPKDLRFDWQMIRRILRLGIPTGLENSLFSFGRVLIMGIITTLPIAVRAANGACNSITGFAIIPNTAVSLACISIIGQLIGADRTDDAKRGAKRLIAISYSGLFLTCSLVFLLRYPLCGLYNLSEAGIPSAVQILSTYCPITVCIYPFAFCMPNILRAAGDARYTMTVSLISMLLLRVGLSYLFVYAFGWGLPGIWLAMHADWMLRVICFTARYLNGKWLKKKAI